MPPWAKNCGHVGRTLECSERLQTCIAAKRTEKRPSILELVFYTHVHVSFIRPAILKKRLLWKEQSALAALYPGAVSAWCDPHVVAALFLATGKHHLLTFLFQI